jgi:hypothetical protein
MYRSKPRVRFTDSMQAHRDRRYAFKQRLQHLFSPACGERGWVRGRFPMPERSRLSAAARHVSVPRPDFAPYLSHLPALDLVGTIEVAGILLGTG